MSLANKLRLIKTAREAGMSDAEILREVLGILKRKKAETGGGMGRATGT